ncbi:MAG: ABC transporter permease [Leptolyngbyaceae cyanobacterium bins.59]|nr:ABC transporter permease [Leptolyngbyaceae cyanobacterium bins.59]
MEFLHRNGSPPIQVQRLQVQRYWDLTYALVIRNLKVRYRGSFLGVYWSLMNPLIMTVIYTAIFGKVFGSTTYIQLTDHPMINYSLTAFTGLIVINFCAASTSQALTSVVNNGALLNKISLPPSVFPVSAVMANVFQFAVSTLPLLIIISLITSKSLLNALALLVPFTGLVGTCAGLGLIVSGLYVFFRDLPYLYELVISMLWITSPVFYPAEIVPENIQPILMLNPLYSVIKSIRQIALSGGLPDSDLMINSLLSGLIILAIGWTCFYRWQPQYMDLL